MSSPPEAEEEQNNPPTVLVQAQKEDENQRLGIGLAYGETRLESDGSPMTPIVVSGLAPDSMFAGQLQVGMEILQINNMTCKGMDPKMATQILKGLPPGVVTLTAGWQHAPSSSPSPGTAATTTNSRPRPDTDDGAPVMPSRVSTVNENVS